MNGTRLPAPESDTRQVALDVIASELVESIEVTKSLTPDMDADTLGASIRINTVRAFDEENEFVTLSLGGNYSDLSDKATPEFSVNFAQALTDTIGVSGGLSYSERDFASDNIEPDGWGTNDEGVAFADEIQYRDYEVERKRTGLTLAFDFKASENTTLFARTLYSEFDDTEERRRLIFEFDEDANTGNATSATFSSSDGEIVVDRDLRDRFESQEITTFEFGGETKLSDWELDYKISFAKAEEETNTDTTVFRQEFDDSNLLNITFDYAGFDFIPFQVSQGAAQFLDPTQYAFEELEVTEGLAEDEETAFEFNAQRGFLYAGGEFTFKTGVKLRYREISFDLTEPVFDGFDGDFTLADVQGARNFDLLDINPMPGLSEIGQFLDQNFASFEEDADATAENNVVEDFEVEEDIFAGYVMGTFEKDKLTIIGGVRVERTDNIVSGFLFDGATLTATPNEFEQDYTDVLPSINIRYDLEEDLVIRGALYSSIVRPNVADLAPRFQVDDEREATFGNPQLDPTQATNLDLSAEYYFDQGSVIQAGVFYKDLKDTIFVAEFESDDPPFNGMFNGIAFNEADISINGEDAEVFGFEAAYNQIFDNGLILTINYTYTDAEGEVDGRTVPLLNASENTFNFIIGYEAGPLSARLSLVYRDDYLDELGSDAEEDRFVEEHTQLDFSANYQITDNIQLYLKLININDEPFVAYQNGPDSRRLLQFEEYSWTSRFGVRATF